MNIHLEPHALTPYFYPRINLNLLGCQPEEDPNYREYDLFCLKTRLLPFLEKWELHRNSIQFVPVQRGDKFLIGIRLVDADVRVDLSTEMQQRLENKIKEITSIDRMSCLLFSSDVEIYVGGKKIPANWITSMLPYISVDPVTNPYLNGMYLYVDLSVYPDYNSKYHQLYDEISRQLLEYYQQGAVICNSTFAEAWSLRPITLLGVPIINSRDEMAEDTILQETTNQNGIYIPTWDNFRFAPDRVSFLLDRMAGNRYIRLRIFPGQEVSIAGLIGNLDYLVEGEDLLIFQEVSLIELQQLSEKISYAANNNSFTLSSIMEDVEIGSTWHSLGETYLAMEVN